MVDASPVWIWDGFVADDIRGVVDAMTQSWEDETMLRGSRTDRKRELERWYTEHWSSHPITQDVLRKLQEVEDTDEEGSDVEDEERDGGPDAEQISTLREEGSEDEDDGEDEEGDGDADADADADGDGGELEDVAKLEDEVEAEDEDDG